MHMQLIGSKPGGRLLLFVCLLLSWQVKAQSGFENRIVIQVDGLSVRATVDKPDAKEGETLTLTLAGLTSGATATVTAGPSAGSSGYEVKQVQGKVNAYTLIMPSGVLYIHVKVTGGGQAIRVQTPGIGSGLASVSLSAGEDPSVIDPGETLVAAGTKVTATLTLNAAEGQTLALQRITGQSPDGSWAMLPVEVNTAQPAGVSEGKTIEFTMPASEVILTYTISSKANIKDKPTADSPTEEPVEVPEIAWPGISPEKPVLVITHQIEEKKLELLSQQLQLLPVAGKEEGTVTELVDISLQLENGERVQPGSPVTVTYPYPQGTDARWNFCIVHQISDAGQAISYETIYPESLHIGLRFQVSSFSPFAILYTPPFLPEGTDEPVRVESISLDRTSLTLETDGSDRLSVTFTPADATDKRVVWSSDNESVLTVSDDGMLTAVSPGNALVTARSVNGGFQATCRIPLPSGIWLVSIDKAKAVKILIP